LIERLAGGPEEENHCEDDLWGDQEIGKDLVRKDDALHGDLLDMKVPPAA
jgi:hypothetical protein